MFDGALTTGFDETRPLLIGVGWLFVLAVVVRVAYRRAIAPAHRRGRHHDLIISARR